MASRHLLGHTLADTAPGLAPGPRRGQGEEEAPGLCRSLGVFFSSSQTPFTVTLRWVPPTQMGVQVFGCEDPLASPPRTRNRVTVSQQLSQDGTGRPPDPSHLRQHRLLAGGSGHPVISAGSPLLLQGSLIFCGDRGGRLGLCVLPCEQHTALAPFCSVNLENVTLGGWLLGALAAPTSTRAWTCEPPALRVCSWASLCARPLPTRHPCNGDSPGPSLIHQVASFSLHMHC